MESEYVEIAQINPKSIVLYQVPFSKRKRSKKQIENEINLTRGEYNGELSLKTTSIIKKRVNAWVTAVYQHRRKKYNNLLKHSPLITFVTLTLSSKQIHSDNEIKRKLLTPFIQELRTKFNVLHYLWRAEPQKNGNVHFHILTDSYIQHQSLRSIWNKHQEHLGYISKFEQKHGHRNPNSTDIHSLRSIKNPAAYIVKYLSKNEDGRPLEGRLWGCSDSLKTLPPFELENNLELCQYIEWAKKNNLCDIKKQDACTIIAIDNYKYLKDHAPRANNWLLDYFKSVFEFLYLKTDKSFYDLFYSST